LKNTWVQDSSQADTYNDQIQRGADILLFPHLAIGRLLLLRWKEAFGFETSANERDFLASWEGTAQGNDVEHQVVDMANGSRSVYDPGCMTPMAAGN
jgi:hypothetical protein